MADLSLIKRRKPMSEKKQAKVSRYEDTKFQDELADNKRMWEQARTHWEQLSDARTRANRVFQYYIGNQWSDLIYVKDKYGKESWMSEYDYIVSQGRIPFVQNLMLATGNTIKGQYLSAPSQCVVVARDRNDQQKASMLSAALDEELDANGVNVIDPMLLEQFIISGFIVENETWGAISTKNRSGLIINPVNYNNFIVNNFHDPRGSDVNFVGQIIDTTLDNILATFCKTPKDEEYIKSKYNNANKSLPQNNGVHQTGSADYVTNLSFEMPADSTMCRIYALWEKRIEWRMYEHDYLTAEVSWTKRDRKEVDAENAERALYAESNGVQFDIKLHGIEAEEKMCEYWYYKYLTPFFDCLAFGESPFEHKSHPFTFTLHPLLNGRVYGFMETMIDLNRQINRNYSLRDAMLGGSAKNLLVLDANTIASGDNGMSLEEIGEEVSRINGVITVDTKNNSQLFPKFLNGNTASLGINDMIERDIDMILKLNGLGQAIRGETPTAGTPAARYYQEILQGQTNLLPVFSAFNNHIKQRGMKALSLIRQFKTDSLLRSKATDKEAMMYKAEEARAAKDLDMEVAQSTDTPVYRQLADESLMQFLEKGLISLKQMLKFSSLQFADALLQDIEAAEAQGGMTPQLAGSLAGAQQQLQGMNTRNPMEQELIDKAVGSTVRVN